MFRPFTQSLVSRKLFTPTLTIICLLAAAMLVKGWQPGKQAAAHSSAAPANIFLAPIPSLELDVPGMEFPSAGLIGEKFCYTVRIENTGDMVGYSPYVQLVLPPNVTIQDPGDVSLPGVCALPACTPSTSFPITPTNVFTCPGAPNITPCVMSDGKGSSASVPPGYTLWTITAPIGSLYPSEPGIDLKVCLKMADDAPLDEPLPICHTPIFQYGNSATGGTAIVGTPQCPPVIPTVVALTKRALNYTSNKLPPQPTVEVPTGSCNAVTYELIANIADSKTLTGISIQDQLPGGMTLVNGSVTVLGATNAFTNCTNYGSNFVCVMFNNETGKPLPPPDNFDPRDLVVQFQAYVNNDVLNPASCDAVLINNIATLDAIYQSNPILQQTAELLIEVERVTLQKTATGPFAPTDPIHVVPGSMVNYGLNFQVSQGTTISNTVITDRLPNGISYVGGSASIFCGEVITPLPPTITLQADGSTILQFTLGTVSGCTSCGIGYKGMVAQTYGGFIAGQPVLASDPLIPACGGPTLPPQFNCTSITYNIPSVTPVCRDNTFGGVIVKPVEIEKALVTPQPPEGFAPGSTVTFKLKMCIPSGDTKNIEFTDFLPSPIFNASSVFNVSLSQSPPDVGATLVPPGGLPNATDNSIKFTINPAVIMVDPTQTVCFEVTFSVIVTTAPYADDLYLTNLFQSTTVNTQGTIENHLTGLVIHLAAPKLEITKGVQTTDNHFANLLSGLPDTSEPYDSNVTGVDAKDVVTFYLTVVNTGAAPAYSISIKDSLPLCFKYESFMAISGPLPTLSPPMPALGGMLTFDYPAGFTLPPGANLQLKVVASLPPHPAPTDPTVCESPHNGCQTFTNNSQVQWSSFCDFEGAGICIPHTAFTPDSDAATVTTAAPAITKTFSTDQPHTTDPNVVIGEKIIYLVKIRVPEGKFNIVTITDTLDPGLAVVNAVITPTTVGPITTSNDPIPCVITPPPGPTGGGKITCDPGMVTNSDTDNGSDEFIQFMYEAVVLNVTGNVQGTVLKNTVNWTSTECANVTFTPLPVKVVEPKLQVTKVAQNASGNPITSADAGDEITWVMTVTNSSPSTADAFQVQLLDFISNGQSYVANSLMVMGGNNDPTGLTGNSTLISVNWNAFPLNATSVIKFKVIVTNAFPCQPITNQANMTWVSIPPTTPIPISPHNTNSCPRNGPLGGCGQLNNYQTSGLGSVPVPAPMIAKTIKSTSASHTILNDVTIGEEIVYELKVTLHEGTTPSLTITDALPAGLAAVSASVVTTNGIAGLPSGPFAVTTACGATQTLTFTGPLTVPGDSNNSNNFFTVDLKVRVCDVVSNMGMTTNQTTLDNSATLSIPNCPSVQSQVARVLVVEPKLQIKKEFIPTIAAPGDTVQIKLTITNIGLSDAFDIKVEDILPNPPFTNVTNVSSPNFTPSIVSGGSSTTVTYTGNAGTSLAPNGMAMLTFQTTLAASSNCGFYNNTATIKEYSSLNGVVTGERAYAQEAGSGGLLINGPNCPCVPAPQLAHLVGWWPLDEPHGTSVVNDISQGHNGTPKPGGALAFSLGPVPVPGFVNGAFNFIGPSTSPGPFVEVPDDAALDIGTNDLTIDAWVNPGHFGTTDHPNQPMVNKLDTVTGTGYDFFIEDGTGKLVFKIGAGGPIQTFKSATSLVTGQWQQVTVTVKRSAPAAVVFYINGVAVLPVSPPPVPTGNIGNNKPLVLGGCFEMRMDEIEIFDVALAQDEVQAIVNAASGGKCKCAPPPAQMVAWYPLDEKTGSVITDIAGGFNGFTVGGPLGGGTRPIPITGMVNGGISIQHSNQQNILVLSPFTSPLNFGTGNFSIDAWVLLPASAPPGSAYVIVDKLANGGNPQGYSFYVQGEKLKLAMAEGGPIITTYTSATAVGGGWQHVAVSVDRVNGGKFIINGGPVAPGDNFTPLTGDLSNLEDFQIGGTFLPGFSSDNYGLDEIEIFASAVSVAEMKAIADARQLGKCPLTCSFIPCACGSFAQPSNYTVGMQPLQLATADFEPDGDLDLAVSNADSNNVSILTNNGAGIFSPAGTFGTATRPLGVAVGQFNTNTDTDPDLVTVSQQPVATLTVLLGSAGAGFTTGTPITTAGPDPSFVAVAKFDSDLKDDLAVLNVNGAVYIKLGVGNGTFINAPATPILTGASADSLVVGDFDNNASPDFAVIHRNTNQVTIFLGSPSGIFSQAPTLSTGTSPTYAGVGDFNLDGRQDLAVSNFTGSNVSVFLGNGNGTFAAGTLFPTGSNPRHITVQDYNNDGKLDLAVVSSSSNTVSLLCGNGDGTFKPPVNLNVGSGPFAVISGDFNGDTKPDLATSNVGSNNVSVLLNNCVAIAGMFITINPASLPNGLVGSSYNQQLTQTGCAGGATWSLVGGSLPNGLSLNAATGLISGTPTASGPFSFTVKVTCGSGCMATKTYSVSIAPCTYGIFPPDATFIAVGGNGSVSVTTNSSCAWTAVSNAAWITITSGASGSGDGTVNYTVAPNAGAMRTGLLTIAGQTHTVMQNAVCPVITLNPPTLANGFVGTLYNQMVNASPAGSYTWSISAGTLPSGLTLNPTTGAITGLPTVAGTFTFTARGTGANNCFGERGYTVIISGSGLQFYPLPSPVRLLETRTGFSGCTNPGNPINANDTFTLPARTVCAGIPANAAAVTGNITVIPSGPGFLTLFPSNAAQPTVANSNFAADEITNNVFTVGLGATGPDAGAFRIFSSATTEVIVDVTGYFAPPGTGGLYFHPLATPVRLLETRTGFTGCIAPGTPLTGTGDPNANPNLDLELQGRSPLPTPCNSIPATAQVLVGNATSVLPGGGGYLTIYPSGGTRPTVASSNYAGSDVINGPFAVKLGADGKFKIYTYSTTHLVVDILGYYSEDANDVNGAGLLFNPLPSPVRLLETRPDFPGFPLTGCTRTNAKIQGNLAAATHTQSAGGFCGLPASAQAVVGNVSVVNSEGAGFLTLFPGNLTTAPLVATSNYPAPATFGYNRHYFVGLSPADGTFKVLTQFTTDLILDASGYFAP